MGGGQALLFSEAYNQTHKDEVDTFFERHVPSVLKAVQAIVKPPFEFKEIITVVSVVSAAAEDALLSLKGSDKAEIVKAILRFVVARYAPKSGLVTLLLNDAIISGLVDLVFHFAVKGQTDGKGNVKVPKPSKEPRPVKEAEELSE